ncbi:MAG TPA: glycoside hydrolase family 3 N-terminal domain-containing protein, partial [Myxococcota bacterium]|nr:glycoside hydrolase family 3 N-terminal domain-containing protein [Myxococcota bacterium]
MRFVAAVLLCLVATPALAIELPRPGEPVDVERIIKSMSVEEKVGQLLFVGFGGTEVNPHIEFWVKQRHVGGVALFSRNIVDLKQTASFTRGIHALTDGKVPLFVALDQEGGNVVRVKDGAMTLPGNMALGATRSTTL